MHARAASLLGLAALGLGACQPAPPAPTSTALPTPTTTPTVVTFPTLAPTVTSTSPPPATSTPDLRSGLGAPLFEDDFIANLGWELGENLVGGVSLVDGRLAIAVRRPGGSWFLSAPAPGGRDFLVEVTVRPELCRDDDEFGLAFRVNSLEEHYRFTITCDGAARARRVLQDSSRALLPFTQSSLIFAGPLRENRLGVWANGPDLRFIINGAEVFTAHDIALGFGGFALFVGAGRDGQTTVSFDDFVVRPLLGTPTPTQPPP